MPTTTNRLGLLKHTGSEPFAIEDYQYNWDTLDESPGIFVCTSATRPTWGNGQSGRIILETDSLLLWRWTGTAWARLSGRGHIAYNTVTSSLNTTSTTYQTAVSVTPTIFAGNRKQQITVSGPKAYNTNGRVELGIFRDASQLTEWTQPGDSANDAMPFSMTIFDEPSAGTPAYSLRYRVPSGVGGTSHLVAGANSPIQIAVVEL